MTSPRSEAVKGDLELRFCEWVGLNGPKPSSTQMADYLARELENRETVDAVEAAVTREAITALRIHDDLYSALKASSEAMLALLGAVKNNPAMQKREYIPLGQQCLKAAEAVQAVLARGVSHDR
jgi:hypothetical protein